MILEHFNFYNLTRINCPWRDSTLLLPLYNIFSYNFYFTTKYSRYIAMKTVFSFNFGKNLTTSLTRLPRRLKEDEVEEETFSTEFQVGNILQHGSAVSGNRCQFDNMIASPNFVCKLYVSFYSCKFNRLKPTQEFLLDNSWRS